MITDDKYEMTRVRLSDGSYAYVRTKDGHAITGGTGKYDLYDANGKVVGRGVGDSFPHTGSGLNFDADEKRILQYLGDYEEPIVTPHGVTSTLEPIDWAKESSNLFQNRVQAERNKEISRNKAVDAKVSQYAFTPEGFLGQAMLPTNLFSPVHVVRGVYNMTTDNGYGNFWKDMFMHNNGLFSDEFAKEHPYWTMAGNLAGDALAFGTGTAAWKLREPVKNVIANRGFVVSRGNKLTWIGTKGIGSNITLEYPNKYRPNANLKFPKVEFIESKAPGTGIKLYDAAIKEAKLQNYDGVESGRLLVSAPKTEATWKHYPDKVHLGDYGYRSDFNMVAPGSDKISFNLSVYGLVTPTKDVPILHLGSRQRPIK